MLKLKGSKLQKPWLPCHPPARRRPCRASSAAPAPYGASSECKPGKGNKSVPPRQHTGLPAAQESLCQDTDGMGEGSACIPGNALAEKPITHPVPPPSERDTAKPTGPLERAEHPISRPCWILCSASTSKRPFPKCPGHLS